MSRFEKALQDLSCWRENEVILLKKFELTPDIKGVIRAVDVAFKSEVLEHRIRGAVHSQILKEMEVKNGQPDETETGKHLWDFDWWLTEATLRSLYSGAAALAQLLNKKLVLKIKPNNPQLPKIVFAKIALGDYPCELTTASKKIKSSNEFEYLRAFVNHVKHLGSPLRIIENPPDCFKDCFNRATTVYKFTYEKKPYGPWSSFDIEIMIDGFRQLLLEIIDAACRVDKDFINKLGQR